MTPVAAASYSETDYQAWLDEQTYTCLRHHTRLTASACLKQKQRSEGQFGDLRCQGCGGVEDQPEPCKLHLAYSTETSGVVSRISELDDGKETLEPAEAVEMTVAGTVSLDGAIDIELGDIELNLDAGVIGQLLGLDAALAFELRSLLNGEEAPDETQEQLVAAYCHKKRERLNKPRRVAVFVGRCHKCGGYMMNALERHDGIRDDEVYRCFNCGWRTSPRYQFNRAFPDAIDHRE